MPVVSFVLRATLAKVAVMAAVEVADMVVVFVSRHREQEGAAQESGEDDATNDKALRLAAVTQRGTSVT